MPRLPKNKDVQMQHSSSKFGIYLLILLHFIIPIRSILYIMEKQQNIPKFEQNKFAFIQMQWSILMTAMSALAIMYGLIGLHEKKAVYYTLLGIVSIMTVVILWPYDIFLVFVTIYQFTATNGNVWNVVIAILDIFAFGLSIYSIRKLQKFMNQTFDDENTMIIYGLSASFLLWPLALVYLCCQQCCCNKQQKEEVSTKRQVTYTTFFVSIIIGIIGFLIIVLCFAQPLTDLVFLYLKDFPILQSC